MNVPNGGTVSFSAANGCITGCAPYIIVACQAYFGPQPPPDPQFPFPVTLDFGSQTWSTIGGTMDGCIKKTVPFFFTVKTGSQPIGFSYSAGTVGAAFAGTVTQANGTVSPAQFDMGVQVYVYLHYVTKVIPTPSPTSTPAPTPTPCSPGTPGPDPTKAIQLVDANGNPILNADDLPVYRPNDGHDPQFFINQGHLYAHPITNLLPLPLFAQGLPWDEQRVGGYNSAFVSYATIAIGLYGAASNTPESQILGIENAWASLTSTYTNNPLRDNTYKSLPAINVSNTDLGYNLYNSKAFTLCSSS